MLKITDNNSQEKFWTNKYKNQEAGWDLGTISLPIKAYFDQIENKNLKILIPGAGNGHEAEYLYNLGFENVNILDISTIPLSNFQKRNPDFPANQLIHGNFFDHSDKYDIIVEQTFFCSFPPLPQNRIDYIKQMKSLLNPNGKLIGLWFTFPLTEKITPPYGGSTEEYFSYLEGIFEVKTFDKCYNSMPSRDGKEHFGILCKI